MLEYPYRAGGQYSPTVAGYEAWLADGNFGTFDIFLEECARVVGKEKIINQILAELKDLSGDELQAALNFIRRMK